MSGYSKIYCVGGEGGFLGADGMNPIYFQILVGDADSQWLEVRYFNRDINELFDRNTRSDRNNEVNNPDKHIRPMGNVRKIIPLGPNLPDNLIDACLVFFPIYFESCPSLKQVAEGLENASSIDFHLQGEPTGWSGLREEARPIFKYLIIYEAELKKINGVESLMSGWKFFGEDEIHPYDDEKGK